MKKLALIALAASFVLTLGACGAPASSQQSAPPESTPPASESAAPSEAPPVADRTESTSEPEPVEDTPTDTTPVRIATLKGPLAMGMIQLIDDAKNNKTPNPYEITLAGSPDELVGKIVQGEFDIATIPTNLAATLYQKTNGKVRLAALNTLGVLYLIESGDTIQSVADLKGKTIYATGKGTTPEFVLNYILTANGLTPGVDVTVEYKSEHTELAGLLAAGQADIALLPQPFVTSAMMQNDSLRVALDLTEEWAKVSDTGELAMSGVLVQQKFIEEHPEALKAFLQAYKASVAYVSDPATLPEAAALIESHDIMKAAIAQKALPECNIVFLEGDEMKTAVNGFLKVLHTSDPKSVGGTLPDDVFYYAG